MCHCHLVTVPHCARKVLPWIYQTARRQKHWWSPTRETPSIKNSKGNAGISTPFPLALFDQVHIFSGVKKTISKLFPSSPHGQVPLRVARSMSIPCASSYPGLQRSHNTGFVVSSNSCPQHCIKLQQPVVASPCLHRLQRECSDQLSFTFAEFDRRLFSSRRGDLVPTMLASQP